MGGVNPSQALGFFLAGLPGAIVEAVYAKLELYTALMRMAHFNQYCSRLWLADFKMVNAGELFFFGYLI